MLNNKLHNDILKLTAVHTVVISIVIIIIAVIHGGGTCL